MDNKISIVIRETPDIETSSDPYAARFAGKVGTYLLAVQEAGLISLFLARSLNGDVVLDVGGGHAQLCPSLLREGYSVSVLGSDQSCANRIRRMHGDSVNFVEGNLLQMPFADSQFDMVTSVRLISHINDIETLVFELCRVSRQAIIIDYPTYRSLNILSLLTFPLKKIIEKNTRTYRTFWDGDIRKIFAQHGFVVTATYRQFTLPMALHRLFGNSAIVHTIEELLRKVGITKFLGNPVLVRLDRNHR